jgi:DNA-binding LacI/PurR family transcriptional regulator
VAQVEQLLRDALIAGRFTGGRLPTEVELAEQLGVSRETVRRATEALQREGLLVKFRRKGTFTHSPHLPEQIEAAPSTLLGYLQAAYPARDEEEAVTRAIGGQMLQGALEEAARAGFELVVRRASHTQIGAAFRHLHQTARLRGVIFASYGEEKLLRQVTGLGLPTVLLDHDMHLPLLSSVRDDSFEGARQAVAYLASLGHRRIVFAGWHRMDLNPWRLTGFRQGLRDARLPRRRAWELPTELTEAGAARLLDAVAALRPSPSALYCFNNSLARLVLAELERRGRRVPDELSVLGGGGEDVAGLTCFQADWYELGRRAVQVLVRTTMGHAPEHHLMPLTLRPGVTTARTKE